MERFQINKPELFSPNHLEILRLIVEGDKTKKISSKLEISQFTVRNYICGIKSIRYSEKYKLGLLGIAEKVSGVRPKNRIELIMAYVQYGILEIKPVENIE